MMLTKRTTMTAVLFGLALVAFGAGPPVQQTAEDGKKTPDKMFPDGREYNFGKAKAGTVVKHAFRIVNTSNVPLEIIAVRRS